MPLNSNAPNPKPDSIKSTNDISSDDKSNNVLINNIPETQAIKEDHPDQDKKPRNKRSASLKDIDPANTAAAANDEKQVNIGIVYATINGGLERRGIGTETNPYTIEIADEGVTTQRIKANAVTPEKIARGTINTVLKTDKQGYVTWSSPNELETIVEATKGKGLVKEGSGTADNPYTLGIEPSKNYGFMVSNKYNEIAWESLKGDVSTEHASGTTTVKALNGMPLNQNHFPKGSLLQWDGEEWSPKDIEEIVPKGSIIMWSGNYDTIPKGWALCDGSGKTPDLQERFIVGATYSYEKYNVRSTGGEENVTLTAEQMPKHSHRIGMYNNYNQARYGNANAPWNNVEYNNKKMKDSLTSEAGSNEPHENRPPYFALYFIIKII